jgi:hypothetical protein
MPLNQKNAVLVSGVVAMIHVLAQSDDDAGDYLYRNALELRKRLRHEIEDQVRETLGKSSRCTTS